MSPLVPWSTSHQVLPVTVQNDLFGFYSSTHVFILLLMTSGLNLGINPLQSLSRPLSESFLRTVFYITVWL